METKPIVTVHGDQALFSSLHNAILQGLPKDLCEWRRSYGRPPRHINLSVSFVPFDEDILPDEDTDKTLVSRPYFHIFWTDCDLEAYKTTVKEEINEWCTALRNKNIPDWLIVVVVSDESKVKTKLLPRSSVIDKVKSDFCSKQSDRCIVLTEPLKTDSKSTESWFQLFLRMRMLILQAFNRHLNKYEDNMRSQRDRRNDQGWNYFQFFIVQEELAFMYEMLGLFEDALIQYDELDALIAQFVENHANGEAVNWLTDLIGPCQCWAGLSLSKALDRELRDRIRWNQASFLEFRNYLFSRQCALLFLQQRPWEVARRTLDFLHATVQEMKLLEVEVPEGALSCWVFLSCLEVLETFQRYESPQMDNYNLYTASLLDYARKKLKSLGELCGLMPGTEPTSEQLSRVVDLSSGMGLGTHSADSVPGQLTPLDKLREALSSVESFKKHYLEMCELAMGTYKHISRFRCVRMIGRDLASFYMKVGEPAKAESFLTDAIKMYRQETWDFLADGTMLELAACQREIESSNKYLQTACHVACCSSLPLEDRLFYFDEVRRLTAQETDVVTYLRASPVVEVQQATVLTPAVTVEHKLQLQLLVISHLPRPIPFTQVCVAVLPCSQDQCPSPSHFSKKKTSHVRNPSLKMRPETLANFQPVRKQLPTQINISVEVDRKQGRVVSAGLVCHNAHDLLKRADSGPALASTAQTVVKGDYSMCLSVDNATLQPGANHIQMEMLAEKEGVFRLSQVCFKLGSMELLKSLSDCDLYFQVVCHQPALHVVPCHADHFLAGVCQEAEVTLNLGSCNLPDHSEVTLTAVSPLSIVPDNRASFPLGCVEPEENVDLVTKLFVEPLALSDSSSECKLECHLPGVDQVAMGTVTFIQPLVVQHRVCSSLKRKYIQVEVTGASDVPFMLSQPSLEVEGTDNMHLAPLNKADETLTVQEGQSVSYVWMLQDKGSHPDQLDLLFSCRYSCPLDCQALPRPLSHAFSLQHFQTLYILSYDVVPVSEERVCKTGDMAALVISVRRVQTTPAHREQLVYEVLADGVKWGSSGKSTGVFVMGEDGYEARLEVMPLMSGALHLPTVLLHRYVQSSQDVWTRREDAAKDRTPGRDQFESLADGQVYNSSCGKQVHVFPMSTAADAEVTLTQ